MEFRGNDESQSLARTTQPLKNQSLSGYKSLFGQISKSLSKTWIDDYVQPNALLMKSMMWKFVWLSNYSSEKLCLRFSFPRIIKLMEINLNSRWTFIGTCERRVGSLSIHLQLFSWTESLNMHSHLSSSLLQIIWTTNAPKHINHQSEGSLASCRSTLSCSHVVVVREREKWNAIKMKRVRETSPLANHNAPRAIHYRVSWIAFENVWHSIISSVCGTVRKGF